MASGSALREQIFANDPAHPIVLDLRDVEFCDSTGVSVFVAAKLHTEAAGGELVRRNPSRWVRRVLEVAGTLGVFTIEDPRLTPGHGPSPSRARPFVEDFGTFDPARWSSIWVRVAAVHTATAGSSG